MDFLKRMLGRQTSEAGPPKPPFQNESGVIQQRPDATFNFEWHEPGPENPYGVTLLDCRPLVQTSLAATADPAVS